MKTVRKLKLEIPALVRRVVLRQADVRVSSNFNRRLHVSMQKNDVPGPRRVSTAEIVAILQRKIHPVRVAQPVLAKPARLFLSSTILILSTFTTERMVRHRLRAFRVVPVHPRLAEITQMKLVLSDVLERSFQVRLKIRIRRTTLARRASRSVLRRATKIIPRLSTVPRMFEQTDTIELKKRQRVRELFLQLRVREAFVLVLVRVHFFLSGDRPAG